MQIIKMTKLLEYLKEINNYTWIDFIIDGQQKMFITQNIDGLIDHLDGGDDYYYNKFKSIINSQFNTPMCSPPFNILNLQNQTYDTCFTLKELLNWGFLKQYESNLKDLEEDILLKEKLMIDENDLNVLLQSFDFINNENLKNKILNVKNKFEEIKNS